MRMYLVQRGKINDECVRKFYKTKQNISFTDFVELDYMGSAEFEFGAIPASFRYIMQNFDQYSLFPEKFTAKSGIPVNIFCKTDDIDTIMKTLQDYLNQHLDGEKVNPYRLKEHIRFHYLFKDKLSEWDMRARKNGLFENFWWDIRNQFIIFTGADDRVNAFMKAMKCDHDYWWMAMDPDKREKMWNEAKKRL